MRLNSDVHSYNTRSLHNFHMPIHNNTSATSGQKSLFVSGLELYNGIPGDIMEEEILRNVLYST
jgi:hypothetical protein